MIARIFFIIILLALSAFYSSAETAFTSLSIIQIEGIAEKRGARGRLVKKMLKKPEKLLSTILTGNNLVNITFSVISTQLTIDILGSRFIGIMTGIMTLTILVFGEVIPKNLAIAYNENIAVAAAPFIRISYYIFSPFVYLISKVSALVTVFMSKKQKDPLSMDAILRLVRYAEGRGIVEEYEREMVHAVFRLDQQNIGSIMTHRTDVFSLDKSRKISEVIDIINENGFSRIPVYDKNPEKIVGIVLVKELMRKIAGDDEKEMTLEQVMIEPYFVSENKKVRELLFMMQQAKKNMAIVLDEYSGLSGIVTMEDIVEEIIGELYDEEDDFESEKIIAISDNIYRVSGSTPISMLNDKLGLNLAIGRLSQTIGGYIVDELGRIPKKKEKITVFNVDITMDLVSPTRIISVIVHFSPPK